MTPITPGTPPRRWVTGLLVASLALNLAFLGLVAGSFIRDKRMGPPPNAVRELGFGPFSEALSDADREALRKAYLKSVPDFRAARRQMRADMTTLITALRADPFDAKALREAMDRGSERAAARLALGQSLLLDRISAMTVSERQAFADRLQENLKRHRSKRSGRDDRSKD